MALPNPFAGETDRRLGKTESRGLSRKKARPLREAVSKQALGGAFREEKESDWIHNWGGGKSSQQVAAIS